MYFNSWSTNFALQLCMTIEFVSGKNLISYSKKKFIYIICKSENE